MMPAAIAPKVVLMEDDDEATIKKSKVSSVLVLGKCNSGINSSH